jgi:hypothetical protein
VVESKEENVFRFQLNLNIFSIIDCLLDKFVYFYTFFFTFHFLRFFQVLLCLGCC